MEHVEENLRTYISKNILFSKNTYPYPDDASLLEEGILDSMTIMELVTYVEEKFGITVNDLDIVPDNFDSISKMSSYIRRKNGIPYSRK